MALSDSDMRDVKDLLTEKLAMYILLLLLSNENGLSIRKILDELGRSKYRAVKSALDFLYKKGFIEIHEEKTNLNPAKIAKITNKGRNTVLRFHIMIESLLNAK